MEIAQLFQICNLIVMPCWLALIFIPENPWVKKIIVGVVIALALVYISQLANFFTMEEGGFGSLEDVMILFKNEKAVLSGWVHYLAFDLLIGFWIATTAAAKGISKFLVAPCLLCTFMLGPVGFFLFMILSFFYKGNEK